MLMKKLQGNEVQTDESSKLAFVFYRVRQHTPSHLVHALNHRQHSHTLSGGRQSLGRIKKIFHYINLTVQTFPFIFLQNGPGMSQQLPRSLPG